jgi:hypothetical protein
VKFLPAADSTTAGHFDVESSEDGSTVAAQSGKATSTITVTPVNDAPVLAPVGDKTVNEESLLSFSVTASDPN